MMPLCVIEITVLFMSFKKANWQIWVYNSNFLLHLVVIVVVIRCCSSSCHCTSSLCVVMHHHHVVVLHRHRNYIVSARFNCHVLRGNNTRWSAMSTWRHTSCIIVHHRCCILLLCVDVVKSQKCDCAERLTNFI